MQAQRMDGRKLAQLYRKKIKEDVLQLAQQGISPRLVVVLVGSDPASLTYVRNKVKAAQDVAMRSEVLTLPETVDEETLLRTIESLSADDDVDGILVQLPLPRGLNKDKVIERIAPEKDVDGFTYLNVGRAVLGKEEALYPCTPQGIVALLEAYNVPLVGAEAVVVGRSDIVGKPVAQLLLSRHATVTIVHSKTRHLKEVTRRADVLVVAAGVRGLITGDMIQEGAVVIDVGIHRLDDGTLTGDTHAPSIREKARLVTPVPGGVGPMTIAMLLLNTVKAARQRRGLPFQKPVITAADLNVSLAP